MKQMLRSQIDRWTDFSSSAVKPLVWMLIGPMLVLSSLLIALPFRTDLFLPILSTIGLALIWKWRLNGLSVLLITFAFYFGVSFLLGAKGVPIWQLGWGVSLALALVVSFFTMEEVRAHYRREKEQREKTISDLKLMLYSEQQKATSEKRLVENDHEKLEERLEEAQQEITSLFQLVDASRIEAEKTYKRSEQLSSESLEQHREIETLKLNLEGSLEGFENLRATHESLAEESQVRIKELNRVRTERAQLEMFFETSQEDLKNLRTQVQESSSPKELDSQHRVLETLEKDKTMIKSACDQMRLDHQKLRELLEKAGEDDVANLRSQVEDKKKVLEQTKSELVSIEQQIFSVKKGMQQQGLAT